MQYAVIYFNVIVLFFASFFEEQEMLIWFCVWSYWCTSKLFSWEMSIFLTHL